MASRQTVADFVAYLAGRFGDHVSEKNSGRYFVELVEDLHEFYNEDLWRACKLLRTELDDIKTWENMTAKVMPYLLAAREERHLRVEAEKKQEKKRADRLEELGALLRPVTEEEEDMLDAPEPQDEFPATIHRIACIGIRRRLALTDAERLELQAELCALDGLRVVAITDGEADHDAP